MENNKIIFYTTPLVNIKVEVLVLIPSQLFYSSKSLADRYLFKVLYLL